MSQKALKRREPRRARRRAFLFLRGSRLLCFLRQPRTSGGVSWGRLACGATGSRRLERGQNLLHSLYCPGKRVEARRFPERSKNPRPMGRGMSAGFRCHKTRLILSNGKGVWAMADSSASVAGVLGSVHSRVSACPYNRSKKKQP